MTGILVRERQHRQHADRAGTDVSDPEFSDGVRHASVGKGDVATRAMDVHGQLTPLTWRDAALKFAQQPLGRSRLTHLGVGDSECRNRAVESTQGFNEAT